MADMHDIQIKDLCGYRKRSGMPNLDNIWHTICAVLPKRSMRSCYYHAEAKVKQTGRPWSRDENSQLKDLVALHGRAWSKIGDIMGRYSIAVKDYYRHTVVMRAQVREALVATLMVPCATLIT